MINIRRPWVLLAAQLVALCLTMPGEAAAQTKTTTVRRVGPFLIDRIVENGRFDRCAATLTPGAGMLRIAYNRDLNYAISVPGVDPPASKITFLFGPKPVSLSPSTDAKRVRAWAKVEPPLIEALMQVKRTIAIDLGTDTYRWPIGNTNMEEVMVALEDCTQAEVRK